MARAWDPLFSRGVPARPKVPRPPRAQRWMEKLCGEAEFIGVDGNTIYTDGSAEVWLWMGVRAAYGAVCYDEAGSPMWVMRGVCGEPHPSINRAELMAVIAVLEISAGGMTIKSDSAFVVDGYKRGKSYTTTSRHEAADLWRDLWARVEEMGGIRRGQEEWQLRR